MRNNIVIFITKVWYDCRNIKDTALCETGYYSTSGSNLIQIGVNTVFSGSAKQPTFFGFKFEFAALVQSMALLFFYRELSSVARGGGGAKPPQLACRPKCRIRKIPRFLALLRLSVALDWTKNGLKHSLKRLFRGGANRLPNKMQNRKNITFLALLRLCVCTGLD